ncbi:MAG: hypothetical protein IT539_00940 [Bradyrhizobiaceae bacterium]|nr:hypothetical protein [Bradyrhizobiaceae bacterium]
MSVVDYAIATLPKPLTLVWCWFPTDEAPKKRGPKCRPVLVRRSYMHSVTSQGWLEVAYGTRSLNLGEKKRWHFVIQNAEDLDEIGLPHATRFVLNRTVHLPWTPEFFSVPPSYKEVAIGPLNKRQRERLIGLIKKWSDEKKSKA